MMCLQEQGNVMSINRTASLSVIAGATLALFAGSAAAGLDEAIGRWKHPDNGSVIETTKCDADLCVTLVKVADPTRKDVNNPDEALRSRSLEGVVLISHAKADGDNAWEGDLYNVQDGGTYSGKVSLKSANELKMQGCTAIVLCKSVVWTKEPAE